jgi:hypothetical protein
MGEIFLFLIGNTSKKVYSRIREGLNSSQIAVHKLRLEHPQNIG